MALILAAVLAGQYFLYAKLGLKDVSYRLSISTPEAFEGEEIEITEEITNDKWLPLPWIRTEISCSRWLAFKGQQQGADKSDKRGLISGIFVLKGHQKCRRVWRVRCEKRGIMTVEDAAVTISDLFGLVKPAAVFKLHETVRVLPTPVDIESGELSGEAFIGDAQVQRFILPDPFVISGAKEYTGREPMNRIHWSQTARCGELMAYNNEFTTERRVLTLLNMQRQFADTRRRLHTASLEAMIKAAAFVLDYCCETRTDAAFAANAQDGFFIPAASGYEHALTVLRALAELKNGCGEHIDDFLRRQDMLEYTDIILITTITSEYTEELFTALSASGKRCLLFSPNIEECGFCELRHIPHGRSYSPEGGEDE